MPPLTTVPAVDAILALIIRHEHLAVLAVAMRRILRDRYCVERAGRFVEDDVHFLKAAICGFGEEKVDCGCDEGVAVGELLEN